MICNRSGSLPLLAVLSMALVSLRAYSQAGTVPFAIDHRRGALASSPVDVSFLLDAPAGRHGFVKVAAGHLVDGDGKRIRFWGVNITDWSKGSRQIPTKQDAPLWAATLARYGINSVRFQFLDLETPRGLIERGHGNTQTLDADQLDREDFFIAELEKKGVYVDFNLLVGRPFSEGDGVRDAGLLREGAKGTSLFDTRLIELQKQYARQLLTHTNPYTGHAYTDDPAVAIVEINNENAIGVGFRAPSAFYQTEVTAIYNGWLARHRTPEQLSSLRTLTSTANDQPIPLMDRRGQTAQAPAERFRTEAEFFNDLERDYFTDMESFVKRTLGSKSLVLATADHSHSSSGYPLLLATESMDIIDGHTYWQHPESYVKKSPMVDDPFNSTVVELSRSALSGKPYTVSEVNNPFPNDYAGEGIPILAAYAGLQDWDGIFWYTFEPKIDPDAKPYIGDAFDLSLDPVKMPELAEGALMFLRGDVSHARSISQRSYSRDQVFDSALLPSTERPYFTENFPLDLPLEHEVRIASLDGPPTQAFAASTPPPIIASDTGQLKWYTTAHKAGLVTVDSDRTQGLIGFLHTQTAPLGNLAARVDDPFCTLLLTSIDTQPISASSRLLLIAAGRVENTGQTWNSAGTDVTAWGGAPTRIEPVKGSITLKGLKPARAVSLQAIDGSGQPLGEPVAASRSGDEWRLPLGNRITTWYRIDVSR